MADEVKLHSTPNLNLKSKFSLNINQKNINV